MVDTNREGASYHGVKMEKAESIDATVGVGRRHYEAGS